MSCISTPETIVRKPTWKNVHDLSSKKTVTRLIKCGVHPVMPFHIQILHLSYIKNNKDNLDQKSS